MAHTETLRKFLASRSVAAVFGLQIAFFIGAHAATRIGLNTVADYLGVVIDGAIFGLLLIFQLIPWSWIPDIQMNNELFLSVVLLLAYFAVYYGVAVVLAAPGRIAYRFATSKGNRNRNTD